MANSSVSIRDLGLRAIRSGIEYLSTQEVVVGFPQEGKPGASSGEGASSMSEVIMKASAAEFGVPSHNVPARPFMANSADSRSLFKTMEEQLDLTIARRSRIFTSPHTIGKEAVAQMKKDFLAVSGPPLKPDTIARKGNALLLIDTKQLFNSIQYEVRRR